MATKKNVKKVEGAAPAVNTETQAPVVPENPIPETPKSEKKTGKKADKKVAAKGKGKAVTAKADEKPLVKPGSKTEYVLNLLRKGIAFQDLCSKVEKTYGMPTAGDKNMRMFLSNLREKGLTIEKQGDKFIALS